MSAPERIVERHQPEPPRAPHPQLHVLPGAVSSEAAQIRLDLVTTREDFDALETAWNALFARAGRNTHLFQTFNWLWHWANHFLPAPGEAGPRLAIVTGYAGDRLVMVWPLVSERLGPITQLAWMGEPVSQYGDVLIDDLPEAPDLLRAAWNFVAQRTGASAVQLRKVRADSVIAPLLSEMGATVTAELNAPYLDLASAASFADYEKRYSGNARRNRGRQRRRLADRGAIKLEWHERGADAEALAIDAFRLKRIWLDQRGIISPALTDPRTARFFSDATRADTHPAGCHVVNLSCGDRPVALEIGVRCKDRTAIHVITYDLDFEKTAAGALLLEDSIRRAYDDGMRVYDLLAPGDGYKLEWADEATAVRDWAAAFSIPGQVYTAVYLKLIRPRLKRGFDALPMNVRRRLVRLLSRRTGADA